jgi:hypothetical protein
MRVRGSEVERAREDKDEHSRETEFVKPVQQAADALRQPAAAV